MDQIVYYRGKPIDDLSREELIEALQCAGALIQSQHESARRLSELRAWRQERERA